MLSWVGVVLSWISALVLLALVIWMNWQFWIVETHLTIQEFTGQYWPWYLALAGSLILMAVGQKLSED